jgi:hypothetical protein
MNSLGRLGKPRAVGLLALAALLMVFAACQLVAGVQSRSLDPIASGCSLPSGTGPQMRFANFAPNADALDVCVRASGSSWGEPIILNGGSGCATSSGPFPKSGFTYGQITVPFTAPAPTIDVKTVPGGQSCTAAPVGEVDGVKMQKEPYVTTFVAIGGATGKPKQLVALPEFDGSANGNGGLLRFVDTLTGVGPIDVGQAQGNQLPTTMQVLYNIGSPVPYGGTLAAGAKATLGPVQDNGYMPIIGGAFNVAAAPHGQTDAVLVFSNQEIGDDLVSVYAIGLALDDSYPLEGLYCVESGKPATVSGNPMLMNCQTSALPTLSFDVFNAALYGPNSPYFSAREALYAGAQGNPISTRTSDVMCLTEVDVQTDQSTIIGVGKAGNFNYNYTISTNLSTPFSNGGATQDGGTCPTMQPPGCGGSVPTSALNTAFSCMEKYCSSTGDSSGILNTTTDCLSNNCTGALSELFIGYPACFDCVVDNVASNSTYAGALQTCTTNPSPPLGYDGFNSSMILSKYPIKNSDSYILPSTNYRRSVLYTQVEFPGNLTVDVYCGFFITPLIATSVPYLGCFGGDTTDAGTNASEQAYLNENLWEAKWMADWIDQKSGQSKNPAVVLGDWRVGLGQPAGTTSDSGFPPPTAIGDGTITYLINRGLDAVQGPNWPAAGQCNNCPGTVNLLNAGNTTSYFTLQPFLYKWPSNGTGNPLLDEQLIFTNDVIAVGDAGNTPNAPVSPYYGVNFHVLRPH